MDKLDSTKVKATQLLNDIQDISFIQIGLIIFGAWFLIFFIRKTFPLLAERGPSQIRLYLLGAVPIIRLFLIILSIVWIIPLIFNITFQNFLFIAGGASVAIGFAFKDFVSSVIAGVVAIIERPYRPGDWVEIDGDYGEVKSVGMRAITIITASDDTIVIPHEKIWTKNISNANDGARTLMCVIEFYLEPNHDGKMVKNKFYDVAMTSAFLNYDKPVKIVADQTMQGTRYKIKSYPFDLRDQFEFITDITIRSKEALKELGIKEISFPIGQEEKSSN